MDRYTIGKTDMVLRILREAGLTTEQLSTIESMNRRPAVPAPKDF